MRSRSQTKMLLTLLFSILRKSKICLKFQRTNKNKSKVNKINIIFSLYKEKIILLIKIKKNILIIISKIIII